MGNGYIDWNCYVGGQETRSMIEITIVGQVGSQKVFKPYMLFILTFLEGTELGAGLTLFTSIVQQFECK